MTKVVLHNGIKHVAPPSPQLSQDDLMRDLAVGVDSCISSTGLMSPKICHSPKTQTTHENEDIVYMMYIELVNLIYWKIPGRSGIIFGSILSSLILTRYYSLLYVFAAALTITTGFNLIFVNAYTFIQSVWSGQPIQNSVHPYHVQIDNQRFHLISRDLLEHYVDRALNIIEALIQKTAPIVLVQDSKLTCFAFCISLFIYYSTSFISTKVCFGLFVIGLFTIPYYVEQHQEKVLVWQQKTNSAVDRYRTMIKRQSISFYGQARDTVHQQIRSSIDESSLLKELSLAKK